MGKNNIDDGETLNIKMLPCKNHKNVVHTKLYRSPSAEVCPPKPARAGGWEGGREGARGRTAERIVIYRPDFCESVPSRDPGHCGTQGSSLILLSTENNTTAIFRRVLSLEFWALTKIKFDFGMTNALICPEGFKIESRGAAAAWRLCSVSKGTTIDTKWSRTGGRPIFCHWGWGKFCPFNSHNRRVRNNEVFIGLLGVNQVPGSKLPINIWNGAAHCIVYIPAGSPGADPSTESKYWSRDGDGEVRSLGRGIHVCHLPSNLHRECGQCQCHDGDTARAVKLFRSFTVSGEGPY